MLPKVSVVLAVYNGASTVAAAARSVLGQTQRDFELIIVDDGSTDGTPAALQALAAADGRIRVLTLAKNAGRSAARNAGLAAAKGAYVAIIDADDHWYPGRLKAGLDLMEKRPELVLCGSWGHLEDASGRTLEWRQPQTPEEVRRNLLWLNPFIHCSVLFRREPLQAAGGYDPQLHFSEDYDLYLRLLRRGEGANVPEFLVLYRYHATPEYRLRDERGKLRSRFRALTRYGYPKSQVLCLLQPLVTALLPLRLTLWLKARLGRGAIC